MEISLPPQKAREKKQDEGPVCRSHECSPLQRAEKSRNTIFTRLGGDRHREVGNYLGSVAI
jgi:hypothetical protein